MEHDVNCDTRRHGCTGDWYACSCGLDEKLKAKKAAMGSDKLIEAMAQAMAQTEYPAMSYEELATAALNALREKLGYDPQAAFNAGLERAAVIASKAAQGWLKIGTSQAASNMTAAKYKARHQAGGEIVHAIRAEKEKP